MSRLHLIDKNRSHDTISELQKLLSEAELGDLMGIAFIGLYRGRGISIGYTGTICKDPLLAVGPIQLLSNDLLSAAK